MGRLYSRMKIFHYKEKLDSLSRDNPEVRAPLHIRLKPTNVCNHNCRYCAYRVDNLQLGQDMSNKDFIPKIKMVEILEDFAEIGVKAVTFSGGGEPFCYPYLLDAVKFLIQRNIKFASLTNGANLKGELALLFARHATWLRISIDGWDDESYAHYRNVREGEFTKVMGNILNFKELDGSCYLGISLIVDKYNAAHVYELIGKLYNAKVDSVKVSPCIVSNSGSENNEYHRPIFKEVKKQIATAMENFAGELEIFDAYHELDDKFKKDYSWCPYQQILPVVGADLNIYPCQDKAYNLDEGLLGTIKDKRFRDFWFDGKEKFFKINPSLVCNHHCVANNKNRTILEYLEADKGHLEFV